MRKIILAHLLCLCGGTLLADDWPQWMGPRRDGVWRETGVIRAIPEDGLPVRWRAPVGLGYSGPAVADGRVFVMDYLPASGEVENQPGKAAQLQGEERVLCFAADTGKLLWQYRYPQAYRISYPGGPRCTPTVDGDRVYALGAEGRLSCLDVKHGKLIWDKPLPETYKTQTAIWGYASHPLIHENLLYTLAGRKNSVVIALDKHTGKQVWSALSAGDQGYNAPSLIQHGGALQLLIWTPEGLNSLHPQTGDLYWSVPLKPGFNMSIMAPRLLGDKLYASAIGNVSAMLQLDSSRPAAQILWRGKPKTSVYCSNMTPFLDGDMIYGCDVETGALVGASMKDGQRLWQTTRPTDNHPRRSRHATAFLIKHEDRYFMFNELGDLILAKLSRDGYQELGRTHLLEPTNEAFGRDVVWSHPAFADRAMFARNDRELIRVDLQQR